MTDSTSWDFSDPRNAANAADDFSAVFSEDLENEDTLVILRNLSELAERDSLLKDRFRAQIAELSALLALPEHAYARESLSDFIPTFFDGLPKSTRNMQIILLCLALAENGISLSKQFSDDAFSAADSVSAKASERIAYLQNRFTDAAYMRLTATLSTPRAAYFSSFSDVCEEVYHGLCEYCILPIESSGDGKLRRFYTLIEKFELKIVAVCDIATADNAYTRYALLCHRHISLEKILKQNAKYYAEFSLVLKDGMQISDVILAAEYCDFSLLRADSAPLFGEDGYRHELTFSLTDVENTLQKIDAFLLYLSVTLPEYIPIGIYTRTEESGASKESL